MPSAIAALRMCCQRRVAAGTCWRMRDRQCRKFRSSSWPRQYRLADPVLFQSKHRSTSALDAAVILLKSVVQIATCPMPDMAAELGPDCPGIGIVAVGGDAIRGDAG